VNARPKLVAAIGLLVFAVLLVACLPAVGLAASPPTLTLQAAPETLVYGQAAVLTAQVSAPGATLTLSRRYADEASFVVVGTAVVDTSGKAVWSRRPAGSATFKVEFAGDATWAPASAEALVGVRPRVTLRATARKPVLEGRRITYSVSVRPAHAGGVVELRRWEKSGWTDFEELTLNGDSTARVTLPSGEPGSLAVRADVAADAGHLSGRSAPWKTTVYDRNNPYGVPTRYPHLILVDLSKYKLYYHEYGQVVRVFDCVLGRPSLPTPKGHFKIYAKDPNMGGPYGPRRMRYLGAYAIHGTNEPWLLGRYPRNYSHGCTRLSNAHILWLYSRVHVGTPVWNVP
jgi:hypothetical protein